MQINRLCDFFLKSSNVGNFSRYWKEEIDKHTRYKRHSCARAAAGYKYCRHITEHKNVFSVITISPPKISCFQRIVSTSFQNMLFCSKRDYVTSERIKHSSSYKWKGEFRRNQMDHCWVYYTQGFCCQILTWSGMASMTSSLLWPLLAKWLIV